MGSKFNFWPIFLKKVRIFRFIILNFQFFSSNVYYYNTNGISQPPCCLDVLTGMSYAIVAEFQKSNLSLCLYWRRFLRTNPLWYHKYEKYGNFPARKLFVAQEIRTLFIFIFFFIKKVAFLLVIINESWHNKAYIFLIIELCSPISTFFDENIKKINTFLIMLVSWATKWIEVSGPNNYHVLKFVVSKWVRP